MDIARPGDSVDTGQEPGTTHGWYPPPRQRPLIWQGLNWEKAQQLTEPRFSKPGIGPAMRQAPYPPQDGSVLGPRSDHYHPAHVPENLQEWMEEQERREKELGEREVELP